MKDIKGYEGLYAVDEVGNVFSYRTNKFLSQANCNGYKYVNLCKNKKKKFTSIHRLVAEAFVPNPNNLPIIHHIDGNRSNNHVSNLQWCTQKENVAHCIEIGKFGKMPHGTPWRSLMTEKERRFLSVREQRILIESRKKKGDA